MLGIKEPGSTISSNKKVFVFSSYSLHIHADVCNISFTDYAATRNERLSAYLVVR